MNMKCVGSYDCAGKRGNYSVHGWTLLLLYTYLALLNFPAGYDATAPTLAELNDNSLCIHLLATRSSEWPGLELSFKVGIALAATTHCWMDASKCFIASTNSTIVFFLGTNVEILSSVTQYEVTVVTFAVELPYFLTPVSPPSLIPLQYLANMTDSFVTQVEASTKKSVSVCSPVYLSTTSTSSSSFNDVDGVSSTSEKGIMVTPSSSIVITPTAVADGYLTTVVTVVVVTSPQVSPTTSVSVVYVESGSPILIIPVDNQTEIDNSVIVTIGATVEQWNSDLNLRLAFVSAIASVATSYCAENLEDCQLRASTTFSPSDVKLQDDYPVELSNSNIEVSVALCIPPSTSLLSRDTVPIIPRDTLIAIILRAATFFYQETGRPILKIETRPNDQASSSGNTGIIITIGTTIPLSLLVIAGIGIIVVVFLIIKRRKREESQKCQLPGNNVVALLNYNKVRTD